MPQPPHAGTLPRLTGWKLQDVKAQFNEAASRFAGRLLPVSDPILHRWGVIFGTELRDAGHRPPVIHTMLAATTLEHNLYLVARNVRDVGQSGAAIFNFWEDDPAIRAIASKRRRRRPAP